MLNLKLKKILNEKDMSITDLHKKTGISRNSLTLLANGKSRGIQYDTLDKITTALNVNISELFEIEFDELIIRLGNKKKDFSTYRKIPSGYFEKKNWSIKCSVEEDKSVKESYIPYEILFTVGAKNFVEISVNLRDHEFHDIFYSLFSNNEYLSLIFAYYFSQKVLQNDIYLIDQMNKVVSDELYNNIRLNIGTRGGKFVRSIAIPIKDKKLEMNEVNIWLNKVNEENKNHISFNEVITIKTN